MRNHSVRRAALRFLRRARRVALAAVLILAAACVSAEAAPGPIRVSPNGRYFVDSFPTGGTQSFNRPADCPDGVLVVKAERGNRIIRNDTVWRDTAGSEIGCNIFLALLWENGEPLLRWHKDWRFDVATGRFAPIAESH